MDTNVNPELVDYPVPGNDDSPKTIDLFCQVISAAAIEGRAVFEKFREDQKQDAVKTKEQVLKKDAAQKVMTTSDAKTTTQVYPKKVDPKKTESEASSKTTAKTGAQKTDGKKINTKGDTKNYPVPGKFS